MKTSIGISPRKSAGVSCIREKHNLTMNEGDAGVYIPG